MSGSETRHRATSCPPSIQRDEFTAEEVDIIKGKKMVQRGCADRENRARFGGKLLHTENHRCLYDNQMGLNSKQHGRHYMALLFTPCATGIGHSVSLTREPWLLHAGALGVQLPDRAKLTLH